MDDNDLDSFNVSFIDIVKNFLGLLILILVLLQGSAALTDAARTPLRQGKDEPPQPFSAPLRDYLNPLTDHYYIAGNRVLQIDWGRIAAAVVSGQLTGGGGKREIAIFGDGQPTASITALSIAGPDDPDFSLESDLNSFYFPTVFPSLPPADLPGKEEIDKVVASIIARTAGGARAASFIVAKSGFPLFAVVHQALTQQHICFRWKEYEVGEPLPLYRGRKQFVLDDSRKCRVRRV
jgi:hypothetical protein